MTAMRYRLLLLLVAALALPSAVALAKRAATRSETREIYPGLPRSIRHIYAVSCWKFTVSTVDDGWVYGDITHYTNGKPCPFHGAAVPRYFLHEGSHGWGTKLSGTGFTCSDYRHAGMSKRVIRDLTGRRC
jgi:hypothetical protein